MSAPTEQADDPQKVLDALTNEVVAKNNAMIQARQALQDSKDALLTAQQAMINAADQLLQSNEKLNQLKLQLLNNAANHWKAKAESKPVRTKIVEAE